MEGFEEKLGAVLNNPQMMAQLMQMAQSLGGSQSQDQEAPDPQPQQADAGPQIDFAMLQKIGALASQASIDKNQKELLHALAPYLSREHTQKLEKAMRAARLARLASANFPFFSGR